MGIHVANKVVKLMIHKGHTVKGAKVLVLGITFKENCPDIRNSRVIDVIRELEDFGCMVDVYDPWADPEEVRHEYGLDLLSDMDHRISGSYDAVVLAVAHDKFRDLVMNDSDDTVRYDIKGVLDSTNIDGRL
jgi:UDP-N-acetyl-D-galactosamine dehydrogenase